MSSRHSPTAQGGDSALTTAEVVPAPFDRRRTERRSAPRLMDLSLPELRRILVTTALFLIVLTLFLWMVRSVIIAAFLGVVIAVYLRPLYRWLLGRVNHPAAAAILALVLVILPVLALLVYSYVELREVATYLATHEAEVAAQIDTAVQRLPFFGGEVDTSGTVRRMVAIASNYGARLPALIGQTVGGFTVAAAVFLFTAFYVFTEGNAIAAYLRSKVPARYTELVAALETNVNGVLYGAIYATLVTQTIKSAIVLLMNLIFGVPLAVVLAMLSFIIGFFPIVGSWTVYVPVAAWLLIFRDAALAAFLMLAVGFLVNTVFLSLYLRPKMAAAKSRVLNFYWMFLGLVTGVYTFGLFGVLLGPILIGLLKAVIDTVTVHTNWRLIEQETVEVG